MTVGGVGGAGTMTGSGPVSHELGDIAFLVALLEVETLDLDIGTRLTDMQRLNAVRKAYGERIAELQAHLDRCGDEDGAWVPLSSAGREDLAWDAAANGGAGGVVSVDVGRDPLGDGRCSVRDADGTLASLGEVCPLDTTPRPPPTPSGDQGFNDAYYADPLNAQTFRTANRSEAERIAAERGGQAVTWVRREELASELQALRDRSDNLSSDAEIGMLGLNRLLSRRNQVLQLASNVMSSQHQTAMGLIANLKV